MNQKLKIMKPVFYCVNHPDAQVYAHKTRLYCRVCNGRVIFIIKDNLTWGYIDPDY